MICPGFGGVGFLDSVGVVGVGGMQARCSVGEGESAQIREARQHPMSSCCPPGLGLRNAR